MLVKGTCAWLTVMGLTSLESRRLEIEIKRPGIEAADTAEDLDMRSEHHVYG